MAKRGLDDAARAIEAVTSAIAKASQDIEEIEDPDEAFRAATTLWKALQDAIAGNGLLRARLAERVWKLHELDLAALANRLSTPAHRIGKSRAGQLIQAAHEQRKEETQSELPTDTD